MNVLLLQPLKWEDYNQRSGPMDYTNMVDCVSEAPGFHSLSPSYNSAVESAFTPKQTSALAMILFGVGTHLIPKSPQL